MTAVLRMFVLLCGYEIMPRTVCTRGSGEQFVMSLPVCAYLIETRDGLVLFDAGINAELLRDPALREEYYTSRGRDPAPVVLPCHDFLEQFKRIGAEPRDVRHVALSHTHIDHAGNLRFFKHAEVWIQEAEYELAFSRPTPRHLVRQDFDLPGLRWRRLGGDHTLMPGIELIFTPGHTVGHQSALIELPRSGPAILVGDVGDLMENFDHEILPGQTFDDDAALASIRRINEIRHARNALMFLCHDPNLIQRQKLAPDFYN